MWKKFTYAFLFMLMLASTASVRAQSNPRLGEVEYVKIYPNPVVAEATIKISETIDLERHKVSIIFYNVVGKEVFKVANMKEAEVRFNREGFLPGMYIYQLKIDDRNQSTGRITVR